MRLAVTQGPDPSGKQPTALITQRGALISPGHCRFADIAWCDNHSPEWPVRDSLLLCPCWQCRREQRGLTVRLTLGPRIAIKREMGSTLEDQCHGATSLTLQAEASLPRSSSPWPSAHRHEVTRVHFISRCWSARYETWGGSLFKGSQPPSKYLFRPSLEDRKEAGDSKKHVQGK